ncbi:MAG: polysaccharide biosynthesis/export family protein [Roseomonas sp.]|nr:polysaccharide biosynthesis/export family protein [Roseomonas sp.]MCA3313910.1 polysaccharide biosynthesis/export family protein [Roseomonas sp.]MCA3317162.1 polysaccharide biosynthesis/export family protein [Roseomonas sp.]MCA3342788.1 polysaccharide biosynthesis/export family protein [Roseomonas sp.]
MPVFPRQVIPVLPGLPPGGDQMQPPPVFDQRSLADLPGQVRGTERVGSPTQAEGGPSLVTPLGDLQRAAGPATAVFGAALFTGQPQSSSDAPNPNYVLAPGDRISVRAWGAVDAEQVAQIDPSGNLFLPNIGPIRVAGARVGDLQRIVEGEVRRVYTQQVQVYATVLSTQRIGVFVAGFVRSPGRYAGSASDSILDFLLRAGGVDSARGSFREISVQRGGTAVTSLDLYRFLMDGQIPQIRLQEGDTILVGRQRPLIGADGAVRNNYLFESAQRGPMRGQDLINYARPLPAATNAVVRGVRNAQPFSRYVTLAELARQTLHDQDTVTFVADVALRTVRVTIEGSRLYPSVLVAERDFSLCQILDHVAVDPMLANTSAVFLLRPRLAMQQKRAIDDALDRLERQLFLSPSITPGVAAARTAEANLILSYISRARRSLPEGRLVVVNEDGTCAPVRLEDGDVIVIPERSQTVMVQGEVSMPRAVLWREGMSIEQYLEQAGGLTARGARSTLMLRRPSGQVILEPRQSPQAGDELIALPYLDPKYFVMGQEFITAIFQVALAARVFQNN